MPFLVPISNIFPNYQFSYNVFVTLETQFSCDINILRLAQDMEIALLSGWDLKMSRLRRLQLGLDYLKFDEIEK